MLYCNRKMPRLCVRMQLLLRYEVRVEACTLLGCAASDWSLIQTQEVPPAGQSAPLLELQTDSEGMQSIFLLSWSPPAQANGKILHYELYRRLGEETGSQSTLIFHNISTSYHDHKLLPYTAYEYQVAFYSVSHYTTGFQTNVCVQLCFFFCADHN